MKCFKQIRNIALIFALLLVSGLQAGTTYNQTVNIEEHDGWIVYWGTIDMTDDSTGTYYTQAFLIAPGNEVDGYINIVCSNVTGTEDVNAWLFYNNAAQPTVATGNIGATDANLDSISVNVIADTVGSELKFHAHQWAALKIIGQTANPLTTVTWYVFISKRENARRTGAAAVMNMPAS